MNGIKLTSINYKGIPPAIPDFLGGTVQFGFFPFGTIAGQIRSGKAQAIGIASPIRHKQFPDLPTMAEQGFASLAGELVVRDRGAEETPRALIERLNRDLNALLAEDETIARVDKIGGTVIAGWTPQQTTKMFADEYARWADVAKKAGLSAQ